MRLHFIKVRKVKNPEYSTKGSNGIDFFVPDDYKHKQIHLGRNQQINIPSGIKVTLPDGYALLAVNKSGRALEGLQVGACLIDTDYQGEIHLHVHNVSRGDIVIRTGEKLVQFIPIHVPQAIMIEDNQLEIPFSERGEGGFGSTGL